MRYNFLKMHIKCIAAFREPYFLLPTKAVDVLESYFKALHPRYAIELKDLQTSGGTSFGDVKLTVSALGGRARVEVTPTMMGCDLQNLTASRDDIALLRDFMTIAEDTLRSRLPGVVLQQRQIRAAAWLKIEEGKDAALRFLKSRGDTALGLDQGRYKDWLRGYSLGANLSDRNGRELNVLLEQSGYPGESDLFARGDYVVTDQGEGLTVVGDELDRAFIEFEEFLKQTGLEASVA